MDNFKVYIHTTPDGKRYVGITKQEPEKRWLNGKGYSNQDFKSAIDTYGWENILHEIIAENLTKEQACDMEIFYIKKYNTIDRNFGYNTKIGNVWGRNKRRRKGAYWRDLLGDYLYNNVLEYTQEKDITISELVRFSVRHFLERG